MQVRLKRHPIVVYKRRRKKPSSECECLNGGGKSKEERLERLQESEAGYLVAGVHPLHRMFGPKPGTSGASVEEERCRCAGGQG